MAVRQFCQEGNVKPAAIGRRPPSSCALRSREVVQHGVRAVEQQRAGRFADEAVVQRAGVAAISSRLRQAKCETRLAINHASPRRT